MTAAPRLVPAGDKQPACPTHGPLESVVAVQYTAVSGWCRPRAACPECSAWVLLPGGPWFLPDHLVT